MVNISPLQWFLIVIFTAFAVLGAAPNVLDKETAEKYGLRQFNLGLDLQGGAHLLMEVDIKPVLRSHADDLRNAVRRELRSSRIRYVQLRPRADGSVSFRLVDAGDRSKIDAAMRAVIEEMGGSGNLLTGASARYAFSINDGGIVSIGLNNVGRTNMMRRTIEQSIEVLRRRIDPTGTLEPTIQQQGSDRILLQIPGQTDTQSLKSRINTQAKMTFHLVDESVTGASKDTVTPGGTVMLPEAESKVKSADGKTVQKDKDGQTIYARYVAVYEQVALDGNTLVDAQQTFDRGQPVVSFRFNTAGGRVFCRITQENIRKRFAIVLDKEVISAPVIQSSICGGSGIITGRFTVQGAAELALLLRAGALPAPLKVVEERTVGPDQGQDSIDAGKIASILGLILVVVFMIFTYGRFGAFATVALLLNLLLIAAALSMLGATLTLPGIAGVVLTIGMAVDANVLIFERIREEVRSGRTPMSAIDTGYRRALTTIIDSNLTTVIAAALLFFFGSGPVKGFGVTLIFGILTSMFTAIMVTRAFVVVWWRWRRPTTLPI